MADSLPSSVNATGNGVVESSREGGRDGEGVLGQTRPTGILATGTPRRDLSEGRVTGTESRKSYGRGSRSR